MKIPVISLAELIFVLFVVVPCSQAAESEAVTTFDGTWAGQSTNYSKGCGRINYEITVKDGVISGSARLNTVIAPGPSTDYEVSGKVKADGTTVVRTKGRAAMPGKFSDNEFRGKLTGTSNQHCDFDVLLKKK